jgi:hypothetical protein
VQKYLPFLSQVGDRKQLDLRAYDVILSSSHAVVAKGVLTAPHFTSAIVSRPHALCLI